MLSAKQRGVGIKMFLRELTRPLNFRWLFKGKAQINSGRNIDTKTSEFNE